MTREPYETFKRILRNIVTDRTDSRDGKESAKRAALLREPLGMLPVEAPPLVRVRSV
jgi:hypothetical protein